MNRTASMILLVCAAAALDCWHFSGPAANLHKVEFTLCLVAALAVFAPEGKAAAACLAAGFVLDAMGGKAFYLPILFAVFYCVRGLGGMFYKPGSVYHLAGSMLIVLVAVGIEGSFVFLRAGTWVPGNAIAISLVFNSAVFWLCAGLARIYRVETLPVLRRV